MSIIELNDTILEVVSGGWGFIGNRVTQSNKSIIILSNFNASAKGGSLAGVAITVTQVNSN